MTCGIVKGAARAASGRRAPMIGDCSAAQDGEMSDQVTVRFRCGDVEMFDENARSERSTITIEISSAGRSTSPSTRSSAGVRVSRVGRDRGRAAARTTAAKATAGLSRGRAATVERESAGASREVTPGRAVMAAGNSARRVVGAGVSRASGVSAASSRKARLVGRRVDERPLQWAGAEGISAVLREESVSVCSSTAAWMPARSRSRSSVARSR